MILSVCIKAKLVYGSISPVSSKEEICGLSRSVRALESELSVLALPLTLTNDLLFSELIFKIGELIIIIL